MRLNLVSFLGLSLAAFPVSSTADPVDQPPRMMTLTKGIVCETQEAAIAAFDWAARHPHAEYVDLEENPDCTFITAPVMAILQPLDLHTNDVAGVVIGQATPPNGDTRYIWMNVQMRPRSVEQDA